MLQRFFSTSIILTNAFGNHRNKRVLWLSSFLLIFSCMLLPSFGRTTPDRKASSTGNAVVPAIATSTIIPTRWWIKTPSTFSPTTHTEFKSNLENDCPLTLSSLLRPGIYAYISLTPPLPNRVRADAGTVNPYLGPIQPGDGVRIVEGPLCADGFSWWLVESNDDSLRGWTVEGSKSEQWIVPCPNPTVACKMTPLIPQAIPTVAPSFTKNDTKDTCTSDKFAIGMFAQVEQDSLLVIRSEPYIGSVVGHVGPMSLIQVTDGPSCAGGVLWWKVNVASLNLSGWTAEANLRACSKEVSCAGVP